MATSNLGLDKGGRMRFQERDGKLLRAIYTYDGVLARRHLQTLFWSGKSKRAMDRRLSLLKQNGFIEWPGTTELRTKPMPEPIVWLGWRGALYVAGTKGIAVPHPRKVNENQQRVLQKSLRKEGFRWLREPRWSLLFHDISVIDFRLAVEAAIQKNPCLELEGWINESDFRADPDVIEFTQKKRDGRRIKKKKGVVPDGCFVVSVLKRRKKGLDYRARFLLELDNATHDNTSFGVEKIVAGAAYIRSLEYKKRFGANTGRWLVVTTGEKRMMNLMKQTSHCMDGDTEMFFFSTADHLRGKDPFRDPVWHIGNEEMAAIFPDGEGI